jgi:hypothetical protein
VPLVKIQEKIKVSIIAFMIYEGRKEPFNTLRNIVW